MVKIDKTKMHHNDDDFMNEIKAIHSKELFKRTLFTMMKWLAIAIMVTLLMQLIGIRKACADGDPYAKERDVIVKPDEITVWKEYNGIYVKELPRAQLPNGHFMLDKHNPNFWRDFNYWPCYYNMPLSSRACVNPGDFHKKHYVVELDKDKHHKDVPEPEIVMMFGLGLIFMGIKLKLKDKK